MTMALMGVLVATAAMAAPSLNFKSFGTGDVVQDPAGTWTITNDTDEYGGVYISGKNAKNQLISLVDFSFTSSGAVAGGAPRFSLPISIDGKGGADFYAFMDVNGCSGAALVSTDSPTCTVYAGSETFANWDAFAAAHPTYRTAPNAVPFVIADVAGTYVVSGITLR